MPFDARAAKLLQAGQHFTISECPGLRLVASTQKRSWIYRYKSPLDGRMRQTKIGEWPAVSLAGATVAWEKLRDARVAGDDPGLAKREIRAKEGAAAAADREQRALKDLTVAQVCNYYLERHIEVSRGAKGAAEVRRIFKTMIDDIADRPAVDVTRSVAFDLVESFAHIPVQAAKLRAEMGGAWDYALDAGRLPENTPNWWRLILRGKLRSKGRELQGKKVGTGKRVLSEAELGILIPWLPNFPRLNEDVLELYLWTMARGSEICAMEVEEIFEEADGLWWVVPKAKTKNHWRENATDFRVPLVGRAEAVVRRRMALVKTGYLFLSSGEYGHVEQKTIGATVWMRMPYSKTRPLYERARLPVERWAPHDLRRSSRTLLAKLGCPDEIGEVMIGHMKPGITGTYNLHEYDKEKRKWITLLDQHLESLVRSAA
jgi:integrase